MAYKVETTREYKYLLVDWSGDGSKELMNYLKQDFHIISCTTSDSIIHYILEKIEYDYPSEKVKKQ